jgi:branched-subunit amino acid transport protein
MSAIWVIMVIGGALTYLTRLSFLGILGRWEAPAWVKRALRFVPPAVLSAIIFPEVLIRDGSFDPLNPRLAAAILAGFVAWRTRSPVMTIVVGMAALLVIQAIVR